MAAYPQGMQFRCARDVLDVLVEASDGLPADVYLAAADRVLDRGVLGVEPGDLVGGTGRD